MKKLLSFVCPSCGANLSADDDREFCYCHFCGTKIAVSDENQRTLRHIDEAAIIRAKTENEIKLKQLEIEGKRIDTYTKIIAGAAITFFVFLIIIIAIINFGEKDTTTSIVSLMSSWAVVFLVGLGVGVTIEELRKNTK
jgi:hypothetical protein